MSDQNEPDHKSPSTHSSSHPLADAGRLCQLSAAELRALYERHEVSPVEVIEAVLDRADEIDGRYNAFHLIDHEGALKAAKESEERWAGHNPLGPVDGVPATIKDLVSVKGWPLRLGSRTTSPEPVTEDAPTTRSLREGGAILIGATTTPEFGWKGVADSPLCGVTLNPWNSALTPGGSSGGAAVAALTGCGVLHLGSDGGGSIRIPAAFSGVVGHKPSFGRVPYFPASAFSPVGHLGPITRSCEDAALMLDVLSVRDVRDWLQNPLPFEPVGPVSGCDWKGLRIGLWTEPVVGDVDPEILAAVLDVAKEAESFGATVEAITLPGENLSSVFDRIWFTGAATRVRMISSDLIDRIDPGLERIVEEGERITAVEYAEAGLQRAAFGTQMDVLLESYDFVISPALPMTAFSAGHDVPPGSGYDFWTRWSSFLFPINLSQQPACSVPIGLSKEGLPMGLQVIAAKGADERVLNLAATIAASRASRMEPSTVGADSTT